MGSYHLVQNLDLKGRPTIFYPAQSSRKGFQSPLCPSNYIVQELFAEGVLLSLQGELQPSFVCDK